LSEPAGAPLARPERGGPQHIPRPPGTRPGPPTPWPRLTVVTVDDVIRAVAHTRVREPDELLDRSVDGHPAAGTAAAGRVRASAVLCAVFDEDGQAHLVLTRRSSRLRSHTGEVAFPGGRLEPGEGPLEGARREAWEEVGLDPALVTPVGRLAPLTTSINPAPITPIVATLPGRPSLTPNPAEVARVFTVPLAELLAEGVHRSELWMWPDGVERQIHFFELEGDTVWGATARMLADLLDRVTATRRPPQAMPNR
jgi:8-oxo-dGTP pyrophosphatase MutT (NUDIX family)